MRIPTLAFTLGLGAALAGCGGGGSGGGSDGSGSTTVSSAAVPLSSSNAPQAAADATDASTESVGAGDVGTLLFTGVVTQDNAGGTSIAELIRTQILRLDALSGQITPPLVTGAVTSSTLDCTSGGSATVVWNDADNDTEFSSGDSFTLTFNNCIENGAMLSGGMSLTGVTLTGDPSQVAPWSLGASVNFTNLSLTEGGASGSVSGNITLAVQTTDGINLNNQMNISSLSLEDGSKTLVFSGFAFDYSENLNTLAFTLSVSGTLQSSALNGSVSISTPAAFTGIDIDTFPSAGSLQIDGANNTRVTLTATGGDSVQLEVDSNGDGVVDDTLFTTWTALEAL